MRFGWSEHQQVGRVLESVEAADQGTALALLGVALLMLAQDLVLHEASIAVVVD
jgi:hypothetical protein